jgi:osmotically-inducible protein OsmY
MRTQKIDPEEVRDDIVHLLGYSWFFDPQKIRVSVAGSRITLSGTVRSERERRMAAAAAWEEDGVTAVENDLTIE